VVTVKARDEFGDIDIYLFDQILKGRITAGDRLLDAGCGSGRNLRYLLRSGVEVWGVDADSDAVLDVQRLASRLVPGYPADRFRVEPIERMSFADHTFSVVVSSAVLHFARDPEQFAAMVLEMWRVLAPGGMFFARLASSIGIAGRVMPLGKHRFRLPDGTERYLVDEATLLGWGERLRGRLMDPIKTTVVQDQRSMTTWVLRKD
jgi:tellurite methyltransferase